MSIGTEAVLPRVLTGIDLPCDSPGGSVELLRDLYLTPDFPLPADVFMFGAEGTTEAQPTGKSPTLLDVPGKAVSGEDFWSYVDRLSLALEERFSAGGHTVLHLQHLTFGATPALLRAFPELATIALVHGTDLLYAAEFETQANVLRSTAAAADAIVVPTAAMADRLEAIAPGAARRIEHIPWGVPDHLLSRRVVREQRESSAVRALYAGRLATEKAHPSIFSAVAAADRVELSVAAPAAEYARYAELDRLPNVRYLGWLPRQGLWREFAEHDLLIVPSLKLEAFGLVAIEAQACGLPVMYQPVPGLTEIIGDSGIAVDFTDTESLTGQLKRIGDSSGLLGEFADAGLANSRKYPLTRTARELGELSRAVMA